MKNIVTLLCSLTLLLFSANAVAQCVPDGTTPNVTGMYPASLPDDTLNQFYSQVLTLVYPKDTVFKFGFLSFPIRVCEIQVLSVTGVPAGMTYQLGQGGTSFIPDYNSPDRYQRGCVLFSGTPTSKATNDSITVQVNIVAGDTALDASGNCVLFNPGFDISAFTKRTYKTGFHLIDTATNAVQSDLLRTFAVSPNPARETGRAAFTLTHSATVQASVMDLTGRIVWQSEATQMSAGSHSLSLDYQGLASGAYLVALSADGRQVATRKLMLMR